MVLATVSHVVILSSGVQGKKLAISQTGETQHNQVSYGTALQGECKKYILCALL